MDDKNKEIIDFSNQPLGLMAQEGAEIEKEVNANTINNSNPAPANPNVQDNPFAEFATPQVKEEKPAIQNEVSTPVQPVVEPAPVQPVAPAEATPAEPVAPATPVPTPEEVKQQEINEYLSGQKQPPQSQEGENSNASFVMFFVIVAIVAGAIFLFKSGKLDSLLDKDEEIVDKQEEKTATEEEQPKQEEPVSQEPTVPEAVKTFTFKETLYTLTDKLDIYYTTTGTINTDTKLEQGNVVINVNGHISQTMDEYTDFNKGIYYMYINVDKTRGWYKEPVEKTVFTPEKILAVLNSLNKEYKGDGEYKITVEGDNLKKLLRTDNSDYIDLKKLSGKKVTVNYTVENGRLKKTKFDMSQLIPGIKKAYVVQEFYDYNKEADIKIPDEVIKAAKTTKDFKIG